MSIIQGNSIESGVSTYQIERSLRFNSADSAYLNRTPASAGNRKTWTWSGWVKRSTLDSNMQALFGCIDSGAAYYTNLVFDNTTPHTLVLYDNLVGGSTVVLRTTQLFRDVSAWYHIVLAYDTTQATAANRVKLYVNGSQITTFSTDARSSLTQNADGSVNRANQHGIGTRQPYQGNYFNGYLTEVNFIDGQALTPTSFGEYNTDTGVWQPKAYTGSYGTNGFYLDFADNSSTTALGYDAAGSNDWTPNNFSVTAGAGNDSLVDTPTPYGTDTGVGGEVRGNYATWNPLDKDDGISSVTEGNLKVVTNGSNGSIKSTIAFPSGKWYWEVTSDSISGSGTQAIGIMPQSQPPTNNMSDSGKLGYAIDASFSDRKFENGTATSYGTYTQANGAVYMLAFDQDAGKLWYGVNGTWLASGDPAAGTNPSSSSISTSTAYCAAVSDNTVSGTFTANFGQRPFAYTAPSGFKALCTQNLPEPTIKQGDDYFNAKLWTGNGSTQSITGIGFQPDLVWTKDRGAAFDHTLFDAVRGATIFLRSNATSADETRTDSLTSFNSDGFSVGADAVRNNINKSSASYVSWAWKAGGTGVTNTAGTITGTVTVSANTTAGFSVVAYNSGVSGNKTVGHGLGVKPAMIITKSRTSASYNWSVYHTSIASTVNKYLQLNTTAGTSDNGTSIWGASLSDTNSTTFGINSGNGVVASTDCIAYVFAPVEGYSAFGSYDGNNSSTDGTFVYLGFRPRWIMIKSTSSSTEWVIIDTERSLYNLSDTSLYANREYSETTIGTVDDVDILSNGFKLRNNTGYVNSSQTYVYAAFAENPFKYSLAR